MRLFVRILSGIALGFILGCRNETSATNSSTDANALSMQQTAPPSADQTALQLASATDSAITLPGTQNTSASRAEPPRTGAPTTQNIAAPVIAEPTALDPQPNVNALSAPSLDYCSVVAGKPQQLNPDAVKMATRGLSRKTDAAPVIEKLSPIVGKGRGANAKQADDLAIGDLQNNLADAIKQNPKFCNALASAILNVCRKDGHSGDVRDDIPILGARFTREQEGGGIKTTRAELDTRSMEAYEKQLEKDRAELDGLLAVLQDGNSAKNADKKRKAAIALQRYTGMAVVLAALGQRAYLQQTDSLDKILAALASFQDAKSIDDAATMIVSSLGRERLQAYPAKQMNAFEITPFAAELYEKMQIKMAKRSLAAKDDASYQLTGNYRICGNGDMVLQYDLTDKNNLIVDGVTLRIEKDVYSRFRATPENTEFDKAFLQKAAADNGFRSEITTNRGNRDLLLRDGQSIQMYARLTQPGYFYVIGHVMQQEGKRFSYLLELNDDPKNKFVMFVPPDKINQYIDLGEYEMGAPFGTEYMQLVASTQNPAESLPATRWNEQYSLNVIEQSGGAQKELVERVRAAKKVKKIVEMKTHESMLTYTTMPK